MKTSINSVHGLMRTLLTKILFAGLVVAAFSFATIPTWAGDAEDNARKAFDAWEKPVELSRPEVLVKTGNNSFALVSGAIRDAQDPDLPDPIRMNDITTVEQLKNKSLRRLNDTLKDLRKRKGDDRSGACGIQKELKEKIRLVVAALKQEHGYEAAPAPIDVSEDCPPPRKASMETKSGNGLQTVTFATLEGRVIVYLPDDIRAGDTISGTVFTEPKGDTDEEKAKNQNILNSTVLDLAGTKIQAERPMFTWTPVIPQPAQPVRYQLKIVEVLGLPTSSAMTQSVADINLDPKTTQPGAGITPDPNITPGFIIPPLGQQGRLVEIPGPFDGDFANTALRFGPVGSTLQDFEKNTESVSGGFGLIKPLAESPRKIVVESPTNVVGPIEVFVQEGDKKITGTHRNVGVNLSAPKTNLTRGERTTLTVEVRGLEGIKTDVPLQLDSKGVINMDGGNFQNLRIKPSEVTPEGRYTINRAITGVQAGGFNVTATVIVRRFDFRLQDDADPNRLFHFNSFTGDYLFACGGGSCRPGGSTGGTQTGGTTGKPGGTTQPGGTVQPGGTTPPGGTGTPPITPTGTTLTGIGRPSMKGCIITLSHNAPDRRVFARLDACTKTGDANVQTESPKTNVSITDKNITDNTAASPPPK